MYQEATISHPLVGPVAFVARYVARRPLHFSALLALVTAAAVCAVAVQYGMKLVVDTMAVGDRTTEAVWGAFGLFFGLIGVESVLWRIAGWIGCRAIVGTGINVRIDLFRHLSRQPMSFFSGQLSGSLGSRVTSTTGATCAVLNAVVWQVVPPLVDLVGATILFAAVDPRLAVALLTGVAVAALLVGGLGLGGRRLHQSFVEQGARVNGELIDVVGNMWTVKAYSARRRELERLHRLFRVEARTQQRSWLFVERVRMVHDVCLWLVAGGIFAWAIRSWQLGSTTPGDVVLISALTFRLLHGSRDLAMTFVHVATQIEVIRGLLYVIGRPHQVLDTPAAPSFVPRGGAIRFDRVSYGYRAGHDVLRELDLTIAPGERVGIVGPSGGGKSTLIGLLQRLDDVRSGTIAIDGQPIRSLAQDSLRRAIAVVPQDVSLFHRTIRENIRYGRPDATDEEVRAAADAAHCLSFIDALPEGLDTVVGDRGARLSGGQRQRIGIARAFLQDAPIFVLDEATSALDSAAEAEVQRALERLMEGRTVIAVAHRLATVSAFDRVVVLVDGRIVEEGPPASLRCRGGVFAMLWRLQMDGFDRKDAALTG